MSIIHLQRRIAEVGRLRIGEQVAASNGKRRPAKLSTWRVTSPDRQRIARIAAQYGGDVREWESPAGKQWEVITQAESLPVVVPPSDMAFSQHMELWAAGGCQRRCDGLRDSIGDQPCVCDPDNPECSIHTRLSVMLRDIPGLGVWRLDTQGYNAALELQGAVEVIQMAAGRGQMLPAQLRLEQRMTKRPGQGTRRFAVPVIDIEVSPAQLMSGSPMAMVDGTPGTVAIEPPRPRQIDDGSAPLTPVPQSVPEAPAASIADQAAAVKERRQRKNSAQPVPRTGIKPRTAAQAAASRREDPPPPPDEPPPDDSIPMPEPTDPGLPATPAQNRKMHACFRDAQLSDRDDRLAVTSAILGFNVKTSSGLTIGEASKLIDTLETWLTGLDVDGTEINLDDKIREILNTATLAEAETSDEAATDAQS
jgi:hypothetical protein